MSTATAQPTATPVKQGAPIAQAQVGKRARSDAFPINAEFLKFLCTVPAETLKPESGVIYIANRDDKVVDVYRGLIKHGFYSVPILQKTKNKWHGFLDLADIVHCIVDTFGDLKVAQEKDFWTAIERDQNFQQKIVKDIAVYPLSRRNPFHPIMKGFSMFSAIEALAKIPGLHRIPIIDSDRKLVGMITQTQVVNFLNNNIASLGAFRNRPINQMPTSHVTVARVNETDTALDAFKMMHYLNITGLAVVNNENKLVGSISLSDLKLIRADGGSFTRMYQNVHNFLNKSKVEGYSRPYAPVIVEPNDTVESALKKFQQFHVHRLFVVDDKMQPIGVIALKDILLELISE